ncbi:MAG: hypothetical protein HYZ53_12260 [Planctomycetes bacterium]|nr:hypothetical protein [Planctomycetota bacterium]
MIQSRVRSATAATTSVLLCGLLLAVAPSSPLRADGGAPAGVLQPGQPNYDPVSRQLTLQGDAAAPDGLVLVCDVYYGEVRGPRAQTVVKGKKFRFDFPAVEKNRQFLPGKYRFVVDCVLADQPPAIQEALGGTPNLATQVEVSVGDPQEGERVRGEVKKAYVKLIDDLRRLYMVLENEASFTLGRVINARTKAGGKVAQGDVGRMLDHWQGFCKSHFEERMRVHRLDFDELRKSCYISPYPDIERDTETLLNLVMKWYAVSWVEMAKLLDSEPPKAISDYAIVPKRDLLPQVTATATRLYQALGVEGEEWLHVNAFRPEEGSISGDVYLSKTSKFRIKCPPGWEFNTDPVHVTVRIRILPKDTTKVGSSAVAVELMDFPESENAKDLNTAVELSTAERWPGYKRLSGGPMEAPDDNMPGKVRPGYHMVCLAIDKGVRFVVSEYSLYCRWFKRTYTVVAICKEETWDSVKDDVTKINNSFTVLDKAEDH